MLHTSSENATPNIVSLYFLYCRVNARSVQRTVEVVASIVHRGTKAEPNRMQPF